MKGLTLVVALCAFVAVPAKAGLVIMHTANSATGNQAYSSVGLEFTVYSAIRVLELGIYDSGADGIQGTGTLSTVIFDGQKDPLVQTNFTSGDPGDLIGNYRFKTLTTPQVLLPGNYTIFAYGFSSPDNLHNWNIDHTSGPTFNGGDGSISFVQSLWGVGSPPTFPTLTVDNWPHDIDYFDGPNMIYSVVPLPASILLGAFAVGLASRQLREFV